MESLGGVLGGLRGVLGGAGTALEAYKRRLGGSLGRLAAVLGALEAMLEPSGGKKAPKMEPQTVPNRDPEATAAENHETLILTTVRRISMIFHVSGFLLGAKKGSQHRC